jgi:hypothetical protein
MSTPKILQKAARQYRHNAGSDEFVVAFDFEETKKIVTDLQGKAEEFEKLESRLADTLEMLDDKSHAYLLSKWAGS